MKRDPIIEEAIDGFKTTLIDTITLGSEANREDLVKAVVAKFKQQEEFQSLLNDKGAVEILEKHARSVVNTIYRTQSEGIKIALSGLGDNSENIFRINMNALSENNSELLHKSLQNLQTAPDAQKMEYLKAQVADRLLGANQSVVNAVAADLANVEEVKETVDALALQSRIFSDIEKSGVKQMDIEMRNALTHQNPAENFELRATAQRGVVRQNYRRQLFNTGQQVASNLEGSKDVLYSIARAQKMVETFERTDKSMDTQYKENLSGLNSQRAFSKVIEHRKSVKPKKSEYASGTQSSPSSPLTARKSNASDDLRRQAIDKASKEEQKKGNVKQDRKSVATVIEHRKSVKPKKGQYTSGTQSAPSSPVAGRKSNASDDLRRQAMQQASKERQKEVEITQKRNSVVTAAETKKENKMEAKEDKKYEDQAEKMMRKIERKAELEQMMEDIFDKEITPEESKKADKVISEKTAGDVTKASKYPNKSPPTRPQASGGSPAPARPVPPAPVSVKTATTNSAGVQSSKYPKKSPPTPTSSPIQSKRASGSGSAKINYPSTRHPEPPAGLKKLVEEQKAQKEAAKIAEKSDQKKGNW